MSDRRGRCPAFKRDHSPALDRCKLAQIYRGKVGIDRGPARELKATTAFPVSVPSITTAFSSFSCAALLSTKTFARGPERNAADNTAAEAHIGASDSVRTAQGRTRVWRSKPLPAGRPQEVKSLGQGHRAGIDIVRRALYTALTDSQPHAGNVQAAQNRGAGIDACDPNVIGIKPQFAPVSIAVISGEYTFSIRVLRHLRTPPVRFSRKVLPNSAGPSRSADRR